MTRPYAHRPDVEHAARRYSRAAGLIDRGRANIAARGSAEPDQVGVALDLLWEGLAWGWLTERPLEELRALVGRGPELVRAAIETPRGRSVRLRDVELLVATALLAGDDELAGRAAVFGAPSLEQDGEWSSATLIALVRGDEDAAAEGVTRLREIVSSPTTAPETATWLAHLAEVGAAVLGRDQGALDAALAARASTVDQLHRTAQLRRRWTGVLDRDSVALALVARRRGLVLPTGVAVVPAELLAAVAPGGGA